MAKKVFVCIPFTEEQKRQLKEMAEEYGDEMVFRTDRELSEGDLAAADAVIGNPRPELLRSAGKLEWMQLFSAGADAYLGNGLLPAGTVLTCATGAFGTAISEYMVGMLLLMMKKIPQYLADQKKCLWTDEGQVDSPAGKRILIAGTGNIGLDFAKRIRAFEVPGHPITISGIRKHADRCPDGIDEIHPLGELKEEVRKADVIAVTLPGTAETYHLFDRDILLSCKKGAYLMNVGRGNVIDGEAFADPRVSGNFAAAWFDVFEKEPLPADDPLYRVPQLYITPHITGYFHLDITLENLAAITCRNYRAWHGAGKWVSVIDPDEGYAKRPDD